MFKSQKQKEKGLTLVETVVVVALFTIVMIAVTESIFSFYRINSYTIAQAYQVSHARRGVEALVRDLREMIYADDGAFPLVKMENNRVGFYSDIDRDKSVEYVEYRLATTTLYKRVFNATGTPPTYTINGTPDQTYIISEYVQNGIQNVPIFVYHDDHGIPATATTTVADIRYIQANVIVNIDPIRDPGEFMLQSSASLRNLTNVLE